jgi:DNA-binding PadR family transcriptional regulator
MLLISLLADAPSNGYGLIKSIAERTENQWKPSPGSVYPTLSQLVDEGLVEGTGSGRGEEYRLTDEGRAYATDNAEAMQSAWDDLAGQKQGDDPLYSSFFKLAKAIRQFDSEATPEQRKAIAEQLDAVRRELYRTLSE